MPNWCENRLEISGPEKIIEKIVKSCKMQDGKFDLNGIVPMPAELNITKGSAVTWGLDVLYGDWKKLLEPGWRNYVLEVTGGHLPETREEMIQLIESENEKAVSGSSQKNLSNFINLREARQANDNQKKFGFSDWLDWRIENWGTKWNVKDDVDIDLSETHISLAFNTAWTPPIPVIAALCKQYPEVSATLYYIETGNWFAGTVSGSGGKIIDDPEYDVRAFGEEFFCMEFEDEEDYDEEEVHHGV